MGSGLLVLCCGHQSSGPHVDLVNLMPPGSVGICQVTPGYSHAAPSEGSVLSEETWQGCADHFPHRPPALAPHNCHCTLTPPVPMGLSVVTSAPSLAASPVRRALPSPSCLHPHLFTCARTGGFLLLSVGGNQSSRYF